MVDALKCQLMQGEVNLNNLNAHEFMYSACLHTDQKFILLILLYLTNTLTCDVAVSEMICHPYEQGSQLLQYPGMLEQGPNSGQCHQC
jgi:hypothetical protein